jgi:hypothetical protein
MLQHSKPRLAEALIALAFAALASAAIAQEQPRHDDQQPPDQQQRPDQPAPADQTHRNVRPGHGPQTRPDEHPDEANADVIARYHRAHPHAAARCHDGFFTNTTDRAKACSKHGGIDVWLMS